MEAGLMKNSLVTGTTWMCYSVCLRSIVPHAILPHAIVIARNCQHAIVGAQLSCALMTGYRHESLAWKLAAIPIPDEIYNWATDVTPHDTKNSPFSGKRTISASVVQGSGFGPSAFLVCAS